MTSSLILKSICQRLMSVCDTFTVWLEILGSTDFVRVNAMNNTSTHIIKET